MLEECFIHCYCKEPEYIPFRNIYYVQIMPLFHLSITHNVYLTGLLVVRQLKFIIDNVLIPSIHLQEAEGLSQRCRLPIPLHPSSSAECSR